MKPAAKLSITRRDASRCLRTPPRAETAQLRSDSTCSPTLQMQLARRAAHRAGPSHRCARAERHGIPLTCPACTSLPQGLGLRRNAGEPEIADRAHYEGNGGAFCLRWPIRGERAIGSGARIALLVARGRRRIESRQIVGANEFAKESDEVVEKLRRLVDLMQVGLQVRTLCACLHFLYGTSDVLCNPCSSRPSSRTTRF